VPHPHQTPWTPHYGRLLPLYGRWYRFVVECGTPRAVVVPLVTVRVSAPFPKLVLRISCCFARTVVPLPSYADGRWTHDTVRDFKPLAGCTAHHTCYRHHIWLRSTTWPASCGPHHHRLRAAPLGFTDCADRTAATAPPPHAPPPPRTGARLRQIAGSHFGHAPARVPHLRGFVNAGPFWRALQRLFSVNCHERTTHRCLLPRRISERGCWPAATLPTTTTASVFDIPSGRGC